MPAFSQITVKAGAASRNEQSEAGIQFFHVHGKRFCKSRTQKTNLFL